MTDRNVTPRMTAEDAAEMERARVFGVLRAALQRIADQRCHGACTPETCVHNIAQAALDEVE